VIGMAGGTGDGDDFALVVHDLRTPLSAMRLTAELIGRGDLDARQSELLVTLVSAIDGLTDMTAGLLKSENGARLPTAASRPVLLADLLQNVAGLLEGLATRKGLLLKTSIPEEARLAAAHHPVKLRRILTTLIDNAVKYTDRGQITVSLLPAEGSGTGLAEIHVADSGPGIPNEERHRIFNKGVRGSTGLSSGQGHGLGLWGARLLAREIGGQLSLEDGETGGACFKLLLPVANAPSRDTPAPGPEAIPGGEAHVLVVDDNDTNRRLLAALLESFGITCDQASGGKAALEKLQKADFDAVLLDLHMPDMDGIATAEAVRNLPQGKDVPLIAVTAALESVGDKRLRLAGFREVLTKPIAPTHLYDAMELARRHHRRQQINGSSA